MSGLLNIVGIIALLVILGFLGLRFVLLRPSGSIDEFADLYANDQSSLEVGEQVAVTFFGVSTLLFDDGETQLLIDAFLSRPTVIEYLTGARSDERAVSRFVEDFKMDRVGAIFVAHSHIDHVLDVAAIARTTGASVYGSTSTLNVGRGGNVDESQLVPLAPGHVVQVGRFVVTSLESPHSESPISRLLNEPRSIDGVLPQPASFVRFTQALNFDFVITHGHRRFVVKASANFAVGSLNGIGANVLFLGTARLGLQTHSFQQAFLDESIAATKPDIVVPLHWDDFLRSWRCGEARLNSRLIDRKAAEGLRFVLENAADAGAKEIMVLQSGSRLVVD